MLFQVRVSTGQGVKRPFDGTRLDRHRVAASGVITQRGGDQDIHCHWGLLPNSYLSLQDLIVESSLGKEKPYRVLKTHRRHFCKLLTEFLVNIDQYFFLYKMRVIRFSK